MDIFLRSRILQVMFGQGFSCLLDSLKPNGHHWFWAPILTGKKTRNHLIFKKKKNPVLGHRKLRESQDVLSNGIWLPFMEQPQLKQKEQTQFSSDI